MSVAGTKNFDQPPHDSNRTHLVFSTSGLLLGSRAPLVLTYVKSSRVKKLGFPPFEGKDGDRCACLHCGSMPADAFNFMGSWP